MRSVQLKTYNYDVLQDFAKSVLIERCTWRNFTLLELSLRC